MSSENQEQMQATQNASNNSALMNAFFQQEEHIIVKAEEIEYESGLNWKEIFFEPEVGKSYQIKLVKNLFGPSVVHRKIYKNLPDPKRKGKTFQFTSSGNAKTCKVLDLFFTLNNLKKQGDVLAEQKLDEFLGQTNQGCVIVQIVQTPNTEDIGKFKLMSFSTFGPNATIANLINEKLNPTKAKIDAGFEKEDVFNIFNSSLLLVECTEANYPGQNGRPDIKGRDFTKSAWTKKTQGVYVILDDETKKIHQFTENDIVNKETNQLSPEANIALAKLIEILQTDNLNIHNNFAYKSIGDPNNNESSEKYLLEVNEKVNEIVPVILNAKTIAEIKNYGITDATNNSSTIIDGSKAQDILKNSLPEELNQLSTNQSTNTEQPSMKPSNQNDDVDVSAILNS